MVQVAIEMRGIDDLLRKFRALPERVGNAVARPALRAGANVFLKRTKELAPVLKRTRYRRGARRPSVLWLKRPRKTPLPVPGLLKRSLRTRTMKRKKGRIGYLTQTGKSSSVFTGRAYYGGFLEFGTRNQRGGPRIKPVEFMRRAFRQRQHHAALVVEQEMRRRLAAAVQARRVA